MAKGQKDPDKKTCFIIMPISTPSDLVERYNNDPDHFKHVMSTLIVPAVKEAGLEPLMPIMKGSDLIHAEIIEKLWTSDYVLCDMSILNANVFFELGIRTALNKPAILVKDKFIIKTPFDVSSLNYHEYDCTLKSWEIKTEISKLASHITDSDLKRPKENALWKYFGIQAEASLVTEYSEEDKTDFILKKLEVIEHQISNVKSIQNAGSAVSSYSQRIKAKTSSRDYFQNLVLSSFEEIENIRISDKTKQIYIGADPNEISDSIAKTIIELGRSSGLFGYTLSVVDPDYLEKMDFNEHQ